jgi:glucose uptake protein GlcU
VNGSKTPCGVVFYLSRKNKGVTMDNSSLEVQQAVQSVGALLFIIFWVYCHRAYKRNKLPVDMPKALLVAFIGFLCSIFGLVVYVVYAQKTLNKRKRLGKKND